MREQLLTMLKVMANPKDAPYQEPRCYSCKHRREVPGSAHIACAKPCGQVTGTSHGVKSGWFMYPMLFDPTWMSTPCSTFEGAEAISPAPPTLSFYAPFHLDGVPRLWYWELRSDHELIDCGRAGTLEEAYEYAHLAMDRERK